MKNLKSLSKTIESVMDYILAIELLNTWANSCYNKGKLLATDDEYDTLLKQVIKFENDNPTLINPTSPRLKVGMLISKQTKFKKDYLLLI